MQIIQSKVDLYYTVSDFLLPTVSLMQQFVSKLQSSPRNEMYIYIYVGVCAVCKCTVHSSVNNAVCWWGSAPVLCPGKRRAVDVYNKVSEEHQGAPQCSRCASP